MFILACLATVVLGCGEDSATVIIELQTDYAPVAEFVEVRTTVLRANDEVAERTRRARETDSGAAGVRVAEFDGLAAGFHRIRVQLFDPEGTRLAETSVTRDLTGQTAITLMITRSCEDVVCSEGEPSGERCLAGECVADACDAPTDPGCGMDVCDTADDCTPLSACSRAICLRGSCLVVPEAAFCAAGETCDVIDGCQRTSNVDGGVPDGGVPDGGTGCAPDRPCDDGVACTEDRCVDGSCEFTSNNALCTAGEDGVCEPGSGCQYSTCTPETCVAASACVTASCEGSVCVMSPACAMGQECCGGECVTAGCDDGNACTDDSCGSEGCENVNNTEPCPDGVFCNGREVCQDGACAAGPAACMAPARCDEGMRSCVGCLDESHCPPPSTTFGACGGFSDVCDRSGTRAGPETTYTCTAGACIASTRTVSEGCMRPTEEVECMPPSIGTWSTCVPEGDICERDGTQRRTTTTYACASESCVATFNRTSQNCTRPPTTGNDCSDIVTCEPGTCTSTETCFSQPPCAFGYPGCDHLGTCLR